MTCVLGNSLFLTKIKTQFLNIEWMYTGSKFTNNLKINVKTINYTNKANVLTYPFAV